jgi:hypothetical protein
MEKAVADHIEQQVRSAFAEGAITRVQVLQYGDNPEVEPGQTAMRVFAAPDEVLEDFTPVMTRLGPADLATVDTLITAGIASNRAEAIRWALRRIREHPAYAQLQ